jgi:VWFA-related protein
MKRAALAAICAAMLITGSSLAAEAPARVSVDNTLASGFPTLQSSVLVTDQVGLPITGLKQSDFSVVEDGKSAPVTSVRTVTDVPSDLTAVMVLDTSGSMAGEPLQDAIDAVNMFVDQLAPDAQAGGVSLGGSCSVNPGPGLSAEKAATKDFFAASSAGGDTPLYDATLTAIQESLSAPQGRRMVIVLTDGEDTCSKISMDTLVSAAVRNAVPLTFIGLGPDVRPDILQNLAGLTGGQYFAAEDSGKLADIYNGLNERLRTRYALQFQSGQFADRKEHTFSVRVNVGGVEAAGDARYTPPPIASRPQLSLTAGQKISGPATFEVTNQSPVQLSKADIYLDDTLLETVSGPSLSYTLDPTGLSSGSHVVRAHVWDTTGAESDASVPIELADTGVFGRIPFWVVLGLVLLLPLLALVGIFALNGRRRGLRCATCRRPLETGWSACPYCSRPEPAPATAAGLAAPPQVAYDSRSFEQTPSSNGQPGEVALSSRPNGAGETRVGPNEIARPRGGAAATQVLGVSDPLGAWLVMSGGDHAGTRFRLGTDVTTIGREGDNDVVLDEDAVGRRHAQIRRGSDGYQLTDLDSRNGTRVNGKSITRQLLRQGDIIEIGSMRLAFVTVAGDAPLRG